MLSHVLNLRRLALRQVVKHRKALTPITAGFPQAWDWINSTIHLRRIINRQFVNVFAYSAEPRPNALSLWGPDTSPGSASADYTSWTGLVDRRYTARQLPSASAAWMDSLPSEASVLPLFERPKDGAIPCPRSTALLGFFAQWFTDSFLRTDGTDSRRNQSNHEIDLCQIYGICAEDTALLREKTGGRLRSQIDANGHEYPAYLFEEDGKNVRDEFRGLSYIAQQQDGTWNYRDPRLANHPLHTPARRARLFATGLERGNVTILFSGLSTLFLREHNRLCAEVAAANPEWANDDDRLFETARNINIVQLLRIVVEEYVNHLSPLQFRFLVDVPMAENETWYRTNRINAEFSLLYRWHPLTPDEFELPKKAPLPPNEYMLNNQVLLDEGLERLLDAASRQRAGRISLFNTSAFLLEAEKAGLKKSRDWKIRSYNDYREHYGLGRAKSLEEISSDPATRAALQKVYGDVDKIEFMVGLLAEDRVADSPLGELLSLMVGTDAFTHVYTNPLLSQNVFKPETFSPLGMHTIQTTHTLAQLVERNRKPGSAPPLVTFKYPKGIPGSYGPPIVGKAWNSLDFLVLSGWETYFLKRQKRSGSTVFKIQLGGNKAIALLDHQAISALFADPDLVQDYGFGSAVPPLGLVGDVVPSVFESGPAHDAFKAFYIDLIAARDADLAPAMDKALKRHAQTWLKQKKFGLAEELERLAATLPFEWILGADHDAQAVEDVRTIYNQLFVPQTRWAASINETIPFPPYRRRLQMYRRLLRHVMTAPKFNECLQLAQARGLHDPELVAKQLLFVLGMNSYLGFQNLFKSAAGELARQSGMSGALRNEIAAAQGDLAKTPRLDRFLREVLRLHPPVFFVFGRATGTRTLDSASGRFKIAKGDLLMGVIPFAHQDPRLFGRDPASFDTDRYDNPSATRHLIWPRGPQDGAVAPSSRTCPGKDASLVFAKKLCIALLTDYDWKLEKAPEWTRRKYGLNVAAPIGDMAVASFKRRP